MPFKRKSKGSNALVCISTKIENSVYQAFKQKISKEGTTITFVLQNMIKEYTLSK